MIPLPLLRVYARKDELGQTYSQRPHPLHLLTSTIGRRLLSSVMASNGHFSEHSVQPLHAQATHLSLSISATPSLTASFVVGRRTPVGQTSMHWVARGAIGGTEVQL